MIFIRDGLITDTTGAPDRADDLLTSAGPR